MLKFKRSLFVIALLGSVSLSLGQGAFAQDANRIDALEDQLRQLVGQVEELTFEVKQLKGQLAVPQKTGAIIPKAIAPKKLAVAQQGIEEIQEAPLAAVEQPIAKATIEESTTEQPLAINKAPAPKILGALDNNAAAQEDGGFQGQVLVPLGAGEQISGQALTQDTAPAVDTGSGEAVASTGAETIEQVSLAADTPETLYEKSNESLLRRQFGEAESGFRGFVEKYPDHSLAGSAQYWLGETYYAQGDFRQAAQNFLTGYKVYPKSRRAPDSLLKLGISLNKLGEKEQACAALSTIAEAYPKAVDAKKRAQVEVKRAGC